MQQDGGNAFAARHKGLQSPRSNGRQGHCKCCRHKVTCEPGACIFKHSSAGCSLPRCMLKGRTTREPELAGVLVSHAQAMEHSHLSTIKRAFAAPCAGQDPSTACPPSPQPPGQGIAPDLRAFEWLPAVPARDSSGAHQPLTPLSNSKQATGGLPS